MLKLKRKMSEEDLSLCISCAFSGVCAELVENLVAYECDAYVPKKVEDNGRNTKSE